MNEKKSYTKKNGAADVLAEIDDIQYRLQCCASLTMALSVSQTVPDCPIRGEAMADALYMVFDLLDSLNNDLQKAVESLEESQKAASDSK